MPRSLSSLARFSSRLSTSRTQSGYSLRIAKTSRASRELEYTGEPSHSLRAPLKSLSHSCRTSSGSLLRSHTGATFSTLSYHFNLGVQVGALNTLRSPLFLPDAYRTSGPCVSTSSEASLSESASAALTKRNSPSANCHASSVSYFGVPSSLYQTSRCRYLIGPPNSQAETWKSELMLKLTSGGMCDVALEMASSIAARAFSFCALSSHARFRSTCRPACMANELHSIPSMRANAMFHIPRAISSCA